ncbi:MAG: TniQ family protein, partial [Rhizobiaceae bacterium]|nr:TniQ family protein [Rhizobiaceae bacterium]
MMGNMPPRQLPVRLPPCTDELLSSWISRHAAFYTVPPLAMLRHCLPQAASLRTTDLHLSGDQEIRLASMFAIEPAILHQMTFTNVAQSSRRLIAARPSQYCPNCCAVGAKPAPILRSQLPGWRITCTQCGTWLRGPGDGEIPSPFRQYHRAALRGEKLLDDEAERGIRTWTSPAEIARLLLMRRVVWPLPGEHELWRYR